MKIAWGITGAGEKLVETFETMKNIKKKYKDIDIRVFMSKAGEQVVKYYGIAEKLEENFGKIWVEINSNSPFLAGQIQLGKYDFLLLAPCTSNTVAKISLRIGDTLLTNAAIMAQKSGVPVYIMPTDFKEGKTLTTLPNGEKLELTITKHDVEHVRRIKKMNNTHVFKTPEEIYEIIRNWKNIGKGGKK